MTELGVTSGMSDTATHGKYAGIDEELYREAERWCAPILRRAARRLAARSKISLDDAMQEARCALYKALLEYDYNRASGQLHSYVKTVVRNELFKLMCYSTNAQRRPVSPDLDYPDEGSFAYYGPDRHVISQIANRTPTPESHIIELDDERVFRMRLLNRLRTDRERAVYSCIVHPTDEFLAYMRNVGADEPNLATVGAYLGLSKNVVDWTMHQIKRHATELIEADFPEVRDVAVNCREWPIFHVSRRPNDTAFVKEIVRQRKLDPHPVGKLDSRTAVVRDEIVERVIEPYSWGVVLFLRYGRRTSTVIAEGRFNAKTGKLLSPHGYCKNLDVMVRWYSELASVLVRFGRR